MQNMLRLRFRKGIYKWNYYLLAEPACATHSFTSLCVAEEQGKAQTSSRRETSGSHGKAASTARINHITTPIQMMQTISHAAEGSFLFIDMKHSRQILH
jgi:hypothetical protein